MKKINIIIGLMMALGSAAHAHPSAVNIKEAEKVIVKTGISHKKAIGMVKCLLTLKKFDTAEAAIDAKMAKIKEKCAKYSLSEEKCQKKQHKMAEKIHNCFVKKEFIQEFFKSGKTE